MKSQVMTPKLTFVIAAIGGLSVVMGMVLAIVICLTVTKSFGHFICRLDALRDQRSALTDLDICHAIAAASNERNDRA